MPSNFHLIEGPFTDKFIIRRVRPQDVNKVVQHIKDHFLRDEPISKMLGESEVYEKEFCQIFKDFLDHQMSFWIEDNATGDVAAVRAISLECVDAPDPWVEFSKKCQACKIFYDIGDVLHVEGDLFRKYHVTKMADLVLSSCSPKYRRQGLSKELYKRTLEFLKAEDIPLVKSVFTSPFSRNAVIPLGFEEVSRLYFKDVKDVNGNAAFDETTIKKMMESSGVPDKEQYVSLMAKRL